MTTNYPDEDHWTWRRFTPGAGTSGFHPGEATRQWFRIPPGERADAAQRAEWHNALSERPDLMKRLLDGEPGVVQLGPQVAQGFSEMVHVSGQRLEVFKGEPLIMGWDFGHTPTVIISQEWRGTVRVLAALSCDHGGVRQHISNSVKPWLAKNAYWALQQPGMMLHCYDPAGNTEEQADIDQSPIRVIQNELGGSATQGPVKWEARKGPLLSIMQKRDGLIIDPIGGRPLIQALSGRWYYPQDHSGNVSRDLPKKPNHPWEDLGDAFCYLLARIAPARMIGKVKPKIEIISHKPIFGPHPKPARQV